MFFFCFRALSTQQGGYVRATNLYYYYYYISYIIISPGALNIHVQRYLICIMLIMLLLLIRFMYYEMTLLW